jgi:hypothetical protein
MRNFISDISFDISWITASRSTGVVGVAGAVPETAEEFALVVAVAGDALLDVALALDAEAGSDEAPTPGPPEAGGSSIAV